MSTMVSVAVVKVTDFWIAGDGLSMKQEHALLTRSGGYDADNQGG